MAKKEITLIISYEESDYHGTIDNIPKIVKATLDRAMDVKVNIEMIDDHNRR